MTTPEPDRPALLLYLDDNGFHELEQPKDEAAEPTPDQIARSTWSVGDHVLVNTTVYGLPGQHWCGVMGFAPGDAARYPVKVKIPDRGVGQYSATEVLDRRPVQQRGPQIIPVKPHTGHW